MIAVEETKQTSLLCLTYDTFYHAATAWSGGQDAEGVPGEIPGIRALPRAPHVSDTTSLPFQRADPFGEEKIILFFYFLAVMTHTPFGIGQGGRTWRPFVGPKNGHGNFRQVLIYNFRDKCVVFACNGKFANLTQ